MIGPSVMYCRHHRHRLHRRRRDDAVDRRQADRDGADPLPFVSIAVYDFGTAIHRRFEQIQAQLSEMSAVAQEALAGVRVVRAYRQEEVELARFRAANDEYLRAQPRLIGLQGLFYPSLTFLLGLAALVLVLWLGGREVIDGRLTLGEFVAFNAYLAMLSWPMIAFGWVTNLIQRGTASWGRMLEVLDAPPAIVDGRATPSPARLGRGYRGRHLSFAYGDAGAGARRRLVARAGRTDGRDRRPDRQRQVDAGQPAAASVRSAAGHGVRRRHRRPRPVARRLRGSIGMVPQEPFLFSDTIAENVAFGAPRARRGRGPQARRRRGPPRQGRRDVPERLDDHRRRARRDAVGRTEAAHGDRAGAHGRPADPDARRCAVGGRHRHRGGDPARAAPA